MHVVFKVTMVPPVMAISGLHRLFSRVSAQHKMHRQAILNTSCYPTPPS